MTGWQTYAKTMVNRVLARGVSIDPEWRSAFINVPRHEFVPRFYVDGDEGRLTAVVDRHNPGWLRAAYEDEPLVTRRLRVPGPDGGEEYVATSSSSQPTIIAIMLDLLAAEPGMRILEIGTGTGYNAALMCERFGDEAVASVDLDPELVAIASERLARIGRFPRLVAGDGTLGVPGSSPYQRIIVTCAVDTVPPAWIEQLSIGGRIVAPLVEGGALVVLTKTGSDRVDGRVDEECAFFMPLRPSLSSDRTERHVWWRAAPDMPPLPAGLKPGVMADLDFRLWLSLSMRHVQFRYTPDGPPVPTGHAGEPLDMDALADSWRAFVAAGRPTRTRYGLSATSHGGWIWLDDPDSSYRWSLPL